MSKELLFPFVPREMRPIDKKRVDNIVKIQTTTDQPKEIWYVHTVLARCFMPYTDPKKDHWSKREGDYSIMLSAGMVEDPYSNEGRVIGLPYGSKPRLFQHYINTQAILNQSTVIPVQQSMTAMMKKLHLSTSGGKNGPMAGFKKQIMRYASAHHRIVGPGPKGQHRHLNSTPIKYFDVWFPDDHRQDMLWPSEIVLTDDWYYSLKDHAIPFHFEALHGIQNNARAQDIYLWMTQQLHRLKHSKPLLMKWERLYEIFGGGQQSKSRFKQQLLGSKSKPIGDLQAAHSAYTDAKFELLKEGILFRQSPPPIPKTRIGYGGK